MERSRGLAHARLGGLLIGIGMGGFVDGILLHQIMQWHNMLSSRLPPETMQAMRTNMMWDGWFHALVWIITFGGVFLLWSAAQRRDALPAFRWFAGLLILGWGIFNLIEGLINHQLLGIHHVRYEQDMLWNRPLAAWDIGFLLVGGVGFIALGWLMSRSAHGQHPGAAHLRSSG